MLARCRLHPCFSPLYSLVCLERLQCRWSMGTALQLAPHHVAHLPHQRLLAVIHLIEGTAGQVAQTIAFQLLPHLEDLEGADYRFRAPGNRFWQLDSRSCCRCSGHDVLLLLLGLLWMLMLLLLLLVVVGRGC